MDSLSHRESLNREIIRERGQYSQPIPLYFQDNNDDRQNVCSTSLLKRHKIMESHQSTTDYARTYDSYGRTSSRHQHSVAFRRIPQYFHSHSITNEWRGSAAECEWIRMLSACSYHPKFNIEIDFGALLPIPIALQLQHSKNTSHNNNNSNNNNDNNDNSNPFSSFSRNPKVPATGVESDSLGANCWSKSVNDGHAVPFIANLPQQIFARVLQSFLQMACWSYASADWEHIVETFYTFDRDHEPILELHNRHTNSVTRFRQRKLRYMHVQLGSSPESFTISRAVKVKTQEQRKIHASESQNQTQREVIGEKEPRWLFPYATQVTSQSRIDLEMTPFTLAPRETLYRLRQRRSFLLANSFWIHCDLCSDKTPEFSSIITHRCISIQIHNFDVNTVNLLHTSLPTFLSHLHQFMNQLNLFHDQWTASDLYAEYNLSPIVTLFEELEQQKQSLQLSSSLQHASRQAIAINASNRHLGTRVHLCNLLQVCVPLVQQFQQRAASREIEKLEMECKKIKTKRPNLELEARLGQVHVRKRIESNIQPLSTTTPSTVNADPDEYRSFVSGIGRTEFFKLLEALETYTKWTNPDHATWVDSTDIFWGSIRGTKTRETNMHPHPMTIVRKLPADPPVNFCFPFQTNGSNGPSAVDCARPLDSKLSTTIPQASLSLSTTNTTNSNNETIAFKTFSSSSSSSSLSCGSSSSLSCGSSSSLSSSASSSVTSMASTVSKYPYAIRLSLNEEEALPITERPNSVPTCYRVKRRRSFVYENAFRYDFTIVGTGVTEEEAILSPNGKKYEVEVEVLPLDILCSDTDAEQLAHSLLEKLGQLLNMSMFFSTTTTVPELLSSILPLETAASSTSSRKNTQIILDAANHSLVSHLEIVKLK